MRTLASLKPLAGFLVGAALGAALALIYDPIAFFFGGYGSGWVSASLAVLLAWAAAFGAGLLAARIAGQFEIPVATLSVLTGAVLVQSGATNLPLLNWHVVFYGGLYPIFAFFGGAIVYARRHERHEHDPSFAERPVGTTDSEKSGLR